MQIINLNNIKGNYLKSLWFACLPHYHTSIDDFSNALTLIKNDLNAISEDKQLPYICASVLMCWQYAECVIRNCVSKEDIEKVKNFYKNISDIAGTEILFNKRPSIVFAVKNMLAGIYNMQCDYKNALKCELDAYNFYKQMEKEGKNVVKFKAALSIEHGYTLLRTNKLKKADKVITRAIDIKKKINSTYRLFSALIYKTEINIRQNKLTTAYRVCEDALDIYSQKEKSNFTRLLEVICYYNMAIIKYRQNELKKATEHFQKFSELSKQFCTSFLEKELYEKLLSENAFEITNDKPRMKVYLQNSLKIFSAIYGENHSVIKDFVAENCKNYSWLKRKLIALGHYMRYYFDF